MARRYRGPHSPGQGELVPQAPPAPAWHGRRPRPMGARLNMLFVAPLAILVSAFFQPPMGLALDLAAFGLLELAAWLTREGVAAHAAYDARRIARRPAFPRKIAGAVLTGAGLFLAGITPETSLAAPAMLGLLGVALHLLAFGPDPLRDKGADDIDLYQTDRVARAVEEAEKHLAAMAEAIRRTGDRELEARVERFQATARQMMRTVEDDPRDLTAARRYLGVYLLGARDATVKFADLYARNRDGQARADFIALLDDLEKNFAARTATLLEDDRVDLDIEIEVLRDRLAREKVVRG
ncbi:MAG: hypothetical protein D6811_01415 [Alphaproteobacteria bacterium]|nr:MAG: hypothetical protein D6811_01415 [Alphaproteobacteria bacterium]